VGAGGIGKSAAPPAGDGDAAAGGVAESSARKNWVNSPGWGAGAGGGTGGAAATSARMAGGAERGVGSWVNMRVNSPAVSGCAAADDCKTGAGWLYAAGGPGANPLAGGAAGGAGAEADSSCGVGLGAGALARTVAGFAGLGANAAESLAADSVVAS
jgi:hypothetical protein